MTTTPTRIGFRSVAPLLAVATLIGAGRIEAQDRYTVSGGAVDVYNLAGTVEIVSGSGSEVVVEVMRRGRDADRLAVEADGSSLRVIYPMDDIVYPEMRHSRTELRYRDDGTWGDHGWGGRGRRIRITGSGRGLEAYADLVISIPNGQRLNVYLAVGEATVTDVDADLLIDTGAAPVTARGTRGVLSVDVGSGSVLVEDAEGDVELDTGSGSVEVYRVSADRLYVDTGSGRVRGSDLSARQVLVDTGSGSVDLQRVSSPDVVLDTGSGSVTVELLQSANDVRIDTGSGSVTVVLPSDVGAEVEIETGSGGIDLDFPIRVTHWERTYIRGVIGDGRGRIEIDTGSGGVRLRRG